MPASAPVVTDSPTRTRLLDAAARLFYLEGVHVGVEALCREAGVSKRSMYQLFDSKEDLLAASLARSVPGYLAALLPRAEDGDLPGRERILALFARLEAVVADPSFQGCPYVSAAIEVKAPEHPARAVSREFHDNLTAFFRAEAAMCEASDPDLLASQLMLVHDGVTARAVVRGGPTPGLAIATATALLDHVDAASTSAATSTSHT